MIAQGRTFILGAEQTSALQLRHDTIDECVETAGKPREHDVEAVRADTQPGSSRSITDRPRFVVAVASPPGSSRQDLGTLTPPRKIFTDGVMKSEGKAVRCVQWMGTETIRRDTRERRISAFFWVSCPLS